MVENHDKIFLEDDKLEEYKKTHPTLQDIAKKRVLFISDSPMSYFHQRHKEKIPKSSSLPTSASKSLASKKDGIYRRYIQLQIL
jgi:hypothetical protein